MSGSRSSRPEPRRRGSRRAAAAGAPAGRSAAPCSRGQTEPIAALVALLAVGAALTLYVAVAAEETRDPERSGAGPAMERLSADAVSDGVVEPGAVPDPESLVRGGRDVRITLRYDGVERQYGPSPPADVDRAVRPVSVRVRPGDVRPGSVTVEVWS